ncbi:MAG: HD domain-containing protein [Thermodesulfobacteriota bacterium]|nr:HD domain-containing protein [Thermodesulfobacteriota bacterium]
MFVFLENHLHKNIVLSIKNNYEKTLQISSSLEEEREKLLSLNKQLIETEDVTIYALAYQAEMRDSTTGHHITRTSKYVQLLTQDLINNKKYKEYISVEYLTEIVKSAPLHDIGKVAIPDKILNKKGVLTKDEFIIMQKHCEFGAGIIKRAMQKLNFRSFLQIAEQLTLGHHEKWDGTGYPRGLKKDEIPLSARIMAVADVYDALRSERPYKKAISHKKAYEILIKDSGKHFDPDIINSFVNVAEQFEKVSIEFADNAHG